MVGGGSFLVLTMTLVASVFDARLGDQNARMAAKLRSVNAKLQARAEELAAQMTSEMRASEARVRAVVDSALDCIIAMDADGRVLDFNPAAERTFGYARADIIGERLADKIIPAAYRERHAKGLERYIATGQSSVLGKRIEITALRADGSEFPIELAITVASTFTMRAFFSARICATRFKISALLIPRIDSSVFGKCWPMSPAQIAPRRASAIACDKTSASECPSRPSK